MFSRHKQEDPPLVRFRSLYQEITNGTLRNLSLEQEDRSREALSGWDTLLTSFGPKLAQVKRDFADREFSGEESFLLEELETAEQQAEEHMDRMVDRVNEETEQLRAENRRQQQKEQAQREQREQQQSSSSSSSSPYGTGQLSGSGQRITMRGHTPRTRSFKTSMRKENQGSSLVVNGAAKTSASAQQAANLIWSPSSSLKDRSYSSQTNGNGNSGSSGDPFENFDSDFVSSKDASSRDALLRLKQQGDTTRQWHRSDDDDAQLDELADQIRRVTTDSQAQSRRQQPRYQKKTPTPSERARAALEKSAQVKLPPPATVHRTRSPRRPSRRAPISTAPQYSSGSSSSRTVRQRTTSPAPERPESPRKELVLSESTKDTELLQDTDLEKQDQERLIASLKGVDPAAARQILNEIIVNGDEVHWEDIAGLTGAKDSLKEAVVYPFLRPDLFSGLREPARGMLLFGPPGTGKTMLARAVATESQSTFFSISASSLTSKFLGESEKLVRALFQLAKKLAPSIIFVDEIDSLLGTRSSDGENEASRRIKNEFLVQWSDLTKAAAGRDSGEDVERVLVLAATNLPWAIDEAARRRFVRRQYIPLPEEETRKAQISKLLSHQHHTLSDEDLAELVQLTDGFSGSDITALAKDAAMGPLRELGDKLLLTAKADIRPVVLKDFVKSLQSIRPSVSKGNLKDFEEWAKVYGSSGA